MPRILKRTLVLLLLPLLLLDAERLAGQSAPASTPAGGVAASTEFEGAAALGLALRRLGTAKRVLMIAAHPDDESTQILSALALGQGAEVAYLSLTRGEGGQNGIGPELQEGLGLLRSGELLAARRLDGAHQYFTRAYDYGFSKNAEEALGKWPREELLRDVVTVIRRFRPDVVVSIFSGTAADGHGQHHVAGIMARDGFRAAADPALRSNGESPPTHAPAKLYQALWRGDADAPETLETGVLDPLLGRSHFQVAMASRSRHRSQDMGRPEEPGPQRSRLSLIDAREGITDTRLFAGVDTLLSQRARSAGAGSAVSPLVRYEQRVAAARAEYNPLRPGALVRGLLSAARELERARELVESRGAPATPLRADLEEERAKLTEALSLAAGLRLDAFAERETVVPGDPLEITIRFWNGGAETIVLRELSPVADGWLVEELEPLPGSLPPGTLAARRFRLTPPTELLPSEPYFLRQPREGDMYRWPDDARGSWGEAFEPPLLVATADLELSGTSLRTTRPVTYRGVDLRSGEFRRPLRAVPAVSLLMEPEQALFVAGQEGPATRRLTVRARSEAQAAVAGTLRLLAPVGWRVEPAEVPLTFAAGGEERTVQLALHAPAGVPAGTHELSAVFDAEGRRYDRGYRLVDYPHIDPRPLYAPATTAVRALDVRLPRDLRVGYVLGAGDDTPAALEQLGVQVTLLGAEELATGELDRFHTIVTGVRAYEVRSDLVAHNQRLLDYARRGGTLVVQYNKYEYLDPGIAPYRVEIARPHDRITDPAAPVRILDGDHPAMHWPNRIGAADFEGWVQERGLYHLRSWDERFTPLLEMADPGEEPQRGSLVVAPYGEGVYVYTGLAFFRQLPAGVPGAYRLLANLISLGRDADDS
jgi:LmbE family N-acetylglucosaminyl deacetylase